MFTPGDILVSVPNGQTYNVDHPLYEVVQVYRDGRMDMRYAGFIDQDGRQTGANVETRIFRNVTNPGGFHWELYEKPKPKLIASKFPEWL